MNLPTIRLTVTLTEYRLLKPALDVLANNLASAKLGSFPNRHPLHGIDLIASNVYRNQEFDAEMSGRIISARRKLWEVTQSRKVYLDAFELAALAFALRLSRSKKLVDITEAVSTEIGLLTSKLETYRKRAKRSANAKIGALEYQSMAERWRRNVAWLQYHILYTKVPKNLERWRAQRWREQRQQTSQAIKAALAQRFYEAPSDKHLDRVITLLTTSLRRCRYGVGLIGVLRAPQEHTDFIVGFVVKRCDLSRLPGAPVPAWQAISDRADKFREHQQKTRGGIAPPTETGHNGITTTEQALQVAVPPKVKPPRRYTHNHQALTAEALIDALAEWIYETVTANFNFTREVCEHVKFQIMRELLEPYQGKIAATSVKGLIKELGPTSFSDDGPTLIGEYASLLLAVLLVFRQPLLWMCQATEAICGRALKREQEARYDDWATKKLYRSQREPLGA